MAGMKRYGEALREKVMMEEDTNWFYSPYFSADYEEEDVKAEPKKYDFYVECYYNEHEWIEIAGLERVYKNCKKCDIKYEDYINKSESEK